MKFQSVESRVYPTLGLTLKAGQVVDLPADTNVTGLVAVTDKGKADPTPVTEKVGE